MKGKPTSIAALVITMLLTGIGTYVYEAAHETHLRKVAKVPNKVAPAPPASLLSGTLYLAQGGALYSLSGGAFHAVTPVAGWMQPSLNPGSSSLLAVKREASFSNVYRLGLDGSVAAQLTNNAAPRWNPDPGANHWSFYPRFSPDEQTIFMSYDSSKQGDYQVDAAIWGVPTGGTFAQGDRWTWPNSYTGGDVQPLPLAGGGLLYVKYDLDNDGKMASQIMLTTRQLSTGKALTAAADDCSQPALSPDGTTLAMICSHKQQISQLVLAPFDGSSLGPLRVIVGDQLVAQPAWSPDGNGIAYLAPAVQGQLFQLWWLPKAGYAPPAPSPSPSPSPSASPAKKGQKTPKASPVPSPTPVKPIQITSDLGFDATSPIAWHA
jgi:Tol biopolymer transport system component